MVVNFLVVQALIVQVKLDQHFMLYERLRRGRK
jgi:hypothetical protein